MSVNDYDEYVGGFRSGHVVEITSPNNFRGTKVAAVLFKQKWCPSEGVPVRILRDDEPIPYICIMEERGDTIRRL